MGEAMALLLFPLGLTLGPKVGWKSFTSATVGNDFSCWRPWVSVPALWLDVPRAYLGTLLLSNPNFALPAVGPKDASVRLLLVLGLLGFTQLVQMFAFRRPDDDEDVIAAPVSFMTGMLFALLADSPHGLLVAGLAMIVAMACASGFRSWHGFFLGGMCGMAIPALLLLDDKRALLLPALLWFEPVIICVVFRREFVVPVRR
jgi:hypothetical protein